MKKRNLHDLSHQRLLTCDMGELVPVSCVEALPGDSFRHAASMLLRVSPLVAPVMHAIDVRLHSFFVPNRLIWDNWEDFITGGADGEGGDAGAAPTITPNTGSGFAVGSLADYLGVPTGVDDKPVSALPFRAYSMVWNEFFRDQDLQSELTVSKADGGDTTTNTTLKSIAWGKDYFTAARAWPQRGPEVTLPLGSSAPVVTDGSQVTFQTVGGLDPKGLTQQNASAALLYSAAATGNANVAFLSSGLEADLANATAATVAELRRAIALQSYAEARAMYGAEYVDYLRFAFGVTPDDARIQRPEYLGGGRQTISFSEVLQTGPDADDSGVAQLKGHGISAMRSRSYVKFFSEHGWVISLLSVRPRSVYTSGLHRSLSRGTKESYYQKELEFIGMQEVLNKEIYWAHATPDGTFGYQDRYAEYRHHPSHVSGLFRSTLNHWHLAREFGSTPALNESFITCAPGRRINADTANDNLYIMVNHNLRARRPVAYAKPGKIL